MSHHILVVEDDEDLCRTIPRYLERHGYRVSVARSLTEGRQALDNESPDLVLLDRRLPDGSGLDLLDAMRRRGDRRPVIVLTALCGEADEIDGFAAGANDYVSKPFSYPLLQERIRVWLQYSGPVRHVTHNAKECRVTFGSLSVDLTPAESSLLAVLMARPNEKQTRSELNKAWGHGTSRSRNLDHYVLRLRRKLESIGVMNAIFTVRGGYVWYPPGPPG